MDRRLTVVLSLVMTLKFQYHACKCVGLLVVTMRFCWWDLNIHFAGHYNSYVMKVLSFLCYAGADKC